MPVLDRQAVTEAGARRGTRRGAPRRPVRPDESHLPPSLRGLPPRSVPETSPTPLQKHYVLLSAPALILGAIAITALELGAGFESPLVKVVRPRSRRRSCSSPRRTRRSGSGGRPGRGCRSIAAAGCSGSPGSSMSLVVPRAHRAGRRPRAGRLTWPATTSPPSARSTRRARRCWPAMGRGVDGRSTDIASGQGRAAAGWRGRSTTARTAGPGSSPTCPATEHRERAVVSRVRLHRVRQPAGRRDDDPGDRRRRGRPPPARDRARLGRVGPAGRLPRGRRDARRGGGPRDARGDGAARRAGRDRRAVLAARGRGRRRGVRGARSSGGAARKTPEALEIASFAPDAIPWAGIAFKTTLLGDPRLGRPPRAGTSRARGVPRAGSGSSGRRRR